MREHYPITPIRYALTSLLIILVADKRKEGENRYKFLLRIGGALCDYYQFHDRDYNMGSGYSIRLNGLFTLQRRFGIYLGFENYHIFTWKGYEHKDYENMNPHYLDAQGAVGDARLQMMNLRGSFAISPKVGISAETAWCRRKSHYKYFPDVLSDTFEFRLMFSYHI